MASNRIKTAEQFRQHVFDSIFEDVGLVTGHGGGDGVHVGIVDSVHLPPQWVQAGYDVYSTESYVQTESKDFDNDHGMQVFDILRLILPNATFSFYQVVGADGKTGVTPFTKAIDEAIDDGVDILNLSIGAPNEIPAEASPYYPPISRAIENGVVPVAASGNLEYPDGPRKYVYAPANIPEVVAVGGSETLCTSLQTDGSRKQSEGPYCFESDSKNRVFCGQNGCVADEPCIRMNSTRPYPDNTKPKDGKPDVLAPAHFPSRTGTHSPEDVQLVTGTSYAAPVVVGALSQTLSETEIGSDILDYVPELLSESGRSIDDYPAPKLDAFNFQKRLSHELEE